MNVKYTKIHKSTEIRKLIAFDEGCIGYYAHGHWDSQSFAITVNQEYDLAAYDQPVWVIDVKQGYFKTAATDPEYEELIFSQHPHPGYTEVTYVEVRS